MESYPWIVEVKPVIEAPACYKSGKIQDCFKCLLYEKGLCNSPRGLCARQYYNHKKGCPNYGREGCPPNVKMFDDYFDINQKVYAIYSVFDFKSHVEKMRRNHPAWTQKQCECILYWQGTAKKELKARIATFNELYAASGYEVTKSPEAMGVSVTKTFKNAGKELEWPPVNIVYKVAMAGIPLNK